MAAVPVTIVGILTTDSGSSNATMVGMASLTGLGIGGGPLPGGEHPAHPIAPGGERPAHPIAPGGERPAHPIAPGGPPPRPEHPIELPPPSIWPPGPGIDFPSHPIVIPPPVGPGTPIPPGTLITWKTDWNEEDGWHIVGYPNVPHPSPS